MSDDAQFDRYREVQDALLLWAREKVRKPFTFNNGALCCAFCSNVSAVLWDGTTDVRHAPGCLALRAIAEGVA